jgi:tRNA (adenine57-N1/adenine58-N1)-methyltransferase catalytic subunit
MRTIIKDNKKFLVKDTKKDFHSQFGIISKEDLQKTGKAITGKGDKVSIFNPSFVDLHEKIKRKAQIITLKDIGTIITETGLTKEHIVLEAGSGSGSLTMFLANIAKKVISYDIREDHQNVAKENINLANLKNVEFKICDIREKIDEKEIDIIVLDMPDPWNALENSKNALKIGGFLVVYSPTIPQVQDTVNKIKEDYKNDFIFLKTVENIQRPWDIDGRKVRPVSSYINHTAFLTLVRRI